MIFETIRLPFYSLMIIRSLYQGIYIILHQYWFNVGGPSISNSFFYFYFSFAFRSDDPSFWGAKPLSHDFYFAFLGIASAKQDLRTLKKLILNSFDLSSLNEEQKVHAKSIWLKKWNKFIDTSLKDQTSAILV